MAAASSSSSHRHRRVCSGGAATSWTFWLLLSLGAFVVTSTSASLLGPTKHFHPDNAFDGQNINALVANDPEDVLIGAYYYPWYGTGDGTEFHNNGRYLRDYLRPRQEPSMGEYDDRRPEVVSEHFRMSRQSNIRLWITSWFGPDRTEDLTIRNNILAHPEISTTPLQIAIHYETNNRLGEKAKADNPYGLPKDAMYYTLEEVVPDMEHFCTHYFKHPSYYKIQSSARPVLVLYLSRVLDGNSLYKDEIGSSPSYWDEFEFLTEVVALMKSTVATSPKCVGVEEPFIIGDQVFNTVRTNIDTVAFQILDGITGYDTYGHLDQDRTTNSNGYANEELNEFYTVEQVDWKVEAAKYNCNYIPSVTPGFNDLGTRVRTNSDKTEVKNQLSRRLSPNSSEGSLLAKSLEYARSKQLLDIDIDNLIFVTSFNEWHEDTQIENVVVDPNEQAQVIVKPDGTIEELQALSTTTKALSIYQTNNNGEISPLNPVVKLSEELYLAKPVDESLTQGLTYVAYGDLYLNIMRRATLLPLFVDKFEVGVTAADNLPSYSGIGSYELSSSNGLSYMTSSSIAVAGISHLVIEFWLYSERTEINEPLNVKCQNDGNVVGSTPAGSFVYGRDYVNHRQYTYFVTECYVRDFTSTATVIFEYDVRDDDPNRSTIYIDDLQVYGIETPPIATLAEAPTAGPTRAPTIGPTRAPTKSPTSGPTLPPAFNNQEEYNLLWCETLDSVGGNIFNSKLRTDCTADVQMKEKSSKAHSGSFYIESKVKNCVNPSAAITALVEKDDGSPFTQVQMTFWYAIDRFDKFTNTQGLTLGLSTSGTPACKWTKGSCTGGTRTEPFTTCTGSTNKGGTGGPSVTVDACKWPSAEKVYEVATCEITLATAKTSVELKLINTGGTDAKIYLDDVMVDVK